MARGKSSTNGFADPEWPVRVNKIRNYFGVAHFQGFAGQSNPTPNFRTTNEQIYTLLVLNILRDLGTDNETIEKVINGQICRWRPAYEKLVGRPRDGYC